MSNSSLGNWECQCRMWSDCVSKNSPLTIRGSYTLDAEQNPLSTKMNAHLRVQCCKKGEHLSKEMWQNWYSQTSYASYDAYQGNGRGLNAWPLQQGHALTLLCCQGAFCWHNLGPHAPFEERFMQINSDFFWVFTFIWRWCILLENNVNKNQISTQLKSYERFWVDKLHFASY